MSANAFVNVPVGLSTLVAAAVAIICLSGGLGSGGRASRCRLGVALGATAWGAATVAWLAGGRGIPAPLESVGWIVAALAAGFALSQAPGAPRRLSSGARTLVDGLIVAASALLVAWIAGLGAAYSGDGREALLVTAALAQVTAGAGASVILVRARDDTRSILALGAAGLAGMAINGCALAVLAYAPDSIVAGVVLGACSLALLPLALRGRTWLPVEREDVEPGLPTRASALIPSLAVAVAVAVAAVATLRGELDDAAIAIGAATIILVVLRQILALAENISFGRRLEANVDARTEELRRSEARFRSLVQHTSDVITVIDARGRVGYQSPSTSSVFGYEPSEIEGPLRTDLIHADDLQRAITAADELLARPGATVSVEGRIRSRGGSWRHVEAIATNLLHDPAVGGLVVNTRDITERKQLEEALTYRAFHDPLTNLPNRALFADRLDHALSRSTRGGGAVAVLFLDLDDFKNINDSLGHGSGDQLLAAVGARLLNVMRVTDTVARLGGDEFAILVEDADDVETAAMIARRVLGSLTSPLQIGDRRLTTRASLGIACSPGAGSSAAELLRAADVAMYAAKAHDKGGFRFFEPRMRTAVVQRVELETDLRAAIDRDQLFLQYQPIVSLLKHGIDATEALVRWRHPKQGVVPPVRFIALAEERGFMGAIGSWVLRTACAQAVEWRRRFPDSPAPRMVVNLSATQLEHPSLVEEVERALGESGLEPSGLVLELTESVVLENESAVAKLGQLRDSGVRISIDDFGTGYSSLGYLRRLPLDILKIDRSFIDGLDHISHQSAIVEAILVMCHRLGIEPVAEGVEHAGEAAELRRLRCELAQGFYFAHPSDPERITDLLSARGAITTNGEGVPGDRGPVLFVPPPRRRRSDRR